MVASSPIGGPKTYFGAIMPPATRKDAAYITSLEHLETFPMSKEFRERYYPLCAALLKWVFSKGEKPSGNLILLLTPCVRNTVTKVIELGLEHAFSKVRQHKIDPEISKRLKELKTL